MKMSGNRAALWCLIGVTTTMMAGNAAAYTPKWLDCQGETVTMGADGKPQGAATPAKQILVYDDDSKNLYRFSEANKTTAPQPVTSYTPQTIAWAVPQKMGHEDPYWEGSLDRTTLALKLNYHEKGMTTTTTQQCKAIGPVAGAK